MGEPDLGDRRLAMMALRVASPPVWLTLRKGGGALVVAALLAILAAVTLLWHVRHLDGLSLTPTIPWWALAGLFAAAEVFVLHVQVRREAQTISLSEIPLVLGLFLCGPLALVAARVVGSLAVFVAVRRQPPLKLVYNTALVFAEASLAVAVFRLLLGDLGRGIDFQSWLAVLVAAGLVSGLFVAAVTTLVISFYEERPAVKDFLASVAKAAPMSAMVAMMGLVGVYALHGNPASAWLLAGSVAVLFLGYRAYARLSERHLSLERLYHFSQIMASTPEVEKILRNVLAQSKQLLRSEEAEIVFFSAGNDGSAARLRLGADDRFERATVEGPDLPGWLWSDVVERGSTLLLGRATRDERLSSYLDEHGLREAIVAPFPGDGGVLGTIIVGNRLGDVRTFDADDAQLLETVATQASLALRNGRLIDRLRHEALHDGLTGLPNRVSLQQRVQDELERLKAGFADGVAVMIMDFDGFKDVNDTFGHQHGDLLLRQAAARMRDACSPAVFVSRLGGDEFGMLVVESAGQPHALDVARSMLAALETPFDVEGFEIEMSASVGIAYAVNHASNASDIMKNADAAMYRAKGSSPGIGVYDSEEDQRSPHHLALVAELRQAIGADQLELYVQPKVALATGSVESVEALVRWRHPEHGLLLAGDFIPVAERSGLIRPLTIWVLEQAVRRCADWQQQGDGVGIAVNLAPRSLADVELTSALASLLTNCDLPPGALTLEVTETSIAADLERTIRLLERFRGAGARISIDDFGTGYSSLSHLAVLPVQEVKIDRSLVRTLGDLDGGAIVRAIVQLAIDLGLDVVAEGVESADVLARLVALGCRTGQGYYLARPMPAAEFPAWLRSSKMGRSGPSAFAA